MDMEQIVMPAKSEAELKSEEDGEKDDMMNSRRKTEGIDEAPNDIENPYDPLLEDLRNLFTLSPYDPLQEELDLLTLSPYLCIYRVPERLRQGNEKAYTPQVVSIGPLHHGEEHLKGMEEHKKRYLLDFLSRTRVSFYDCIKMIKMQEGKLRGCYAEPIELGSDEFVRIVLLDAAFVIEFLLRYYSVNFLGQADDTVTKPMMMWDVRPDFLLLENQLPFFILQVLFNTLFSSADQQPSLLEISYFSLQREIDSKRKEEIFGEICSSGEEVQHFVDLIRILYRPLKSKTGGELKGTAVPNVTELVQAGVEFKVGKGSSLFDINFSCGTLKIPKLTVCDTTDLKLKNLLAFELCRHRETNYLTNYVFLMKRLAKTPKDVELLVEYGIIDNWLGDAKKISTLLLDFDTGVVGNDYYYASLCKDLNDYCRSRRHKWMTNLRRNYFNTPWRIISIVAAVILLILTSIQTVCSIISIA
ncbi:UPF0481 protein At3g47200-like isoform X1 [Malus domestica]|uniref:UPF0481 protein At3g47200-like isoform X1 n=2 Tax=Malus domestica TaxID=3750 RepID=UPI003975E3E0